MYPETWPSERKRKLKSLVVLLPLPHGKGNGVYRVTPKCWVFYRQYLTQYPENLILSHFTVGETVWKKLKILPKDTQLRKTQLKRQGISESYCWGSGAEVSKQSGMPQTDASLNPCALLILKILENLAVFSIVYPYLNIDLSNCI